MKKIPTLSIDEILTILGAVPNHRDRPLYSLLVASSCRLNMALQFGLGDVNVEPRTVKLFCRITCVNSRATMGFGPRTVALKEPLKIVCRRRGYAIEGRWQ